MIRRKAITNGCGRTGVDQYRPAFPGYKVNEVISVHRYGKNLDPTTLYSNNVHMT